MYLLRKLMRLLPQAVRVSSECCPIMSLFLLNWGYAEVGPDKVTILADSAEKSDEIDIDRAKEAMKRAEERLKQAEEVDEARATAALDRAAARIHVVQSHIPR
jgi:F-type H+-transporting ATPase subunit epsilon